MIPVLPNEHAPDREGETRKLPSPDQDRSLKAVSDDFRRVLSSDGTLDGDEDCLDHLRDQFRSIEREASRSGYLYEELTRLKIGGVEHDVVSITRPAQSLNSPRLAKLPMS